MTHKVGIIAAFPSELRPLVRGWSRQSFSREDLAWTGTIGRGSEQPTSLIAVAAGMGRESAARACRIARSLLGDLDVLISVGFAGALSSSLRPGTAYRAAVVVDALKGDRFEAVGSSQPAVTLVTADHVVAGAEKQKLRETFEADMVDMEAAVVADIAQANFCKFCSFKTIVDVKDEYIPNFSSFQDEDGKLRSFQLGTYLLLRPQYWPAAARMRKNSRAGARAIARAVREFVGQLDDLDQLETLSQLDQSDQPNDETRN